MDQQANRASVYSTAGPRPTSLQPAQVSTTTLLNTLHNIFISGEHLQLDASTSLVVNTWLTARNRGDGTHGGIIDDGMARRAWEHARRRAEDECIVLASLHESTPSQMEPFLSALPLKLPPSFHTALSIIRSFTCTATPYNPSTARYAALSATFTLDLNGDISGATLAISNSGLDVSRGLLNVPAEAGYRAFDVCYQLLASASSATEREVLGLKHPSEYALLSRSGTFDPPAYLPSADDAASADDFRSSLKAVGIKGQAYRDVLLVLSGLLKLGNTISYAIDGDELREACEEVGDVLDIDPDVIARQCSSDERELLLAGLYECLVDWIIVRVNETINADISGTREDDSSDGSFVRVSGSTTPHQVVETADTVRITVLEVPRQELGRAMAFRGVFDDSVGINTEMKDDGVEVIAAGTSVLKELSIALTEAVDDLGDESGAPREKAYTRERQEEVLKKVGLTIEDEFLHKIIFPIEGKGLETGKRARFNVATVIGSSRVWYHLCLHPTDDSPATLASLPSTKSAWSAASVSRQLRAWRLPEWAHRRNKIIDFTADFEIHEFTGRYARLGCQEGRDGAESWSLERGWSNGEVVVGLERVWMRETAWWDAETMLDLLPGQDDLHGLQQTDLQDRADMQSSYSVLMPGLEDSGYFPPNAALMQHDGQQYLPEGYRASATPGTNETRSIAPTAAKTLNTMPGDYGLGAKGDDMKGRTSYFDKDFDGAGLDPEIGVPKLITSQPTSKSRQVWVAFVWALTFWIPSFVLRYVGRMKRPDVRMAWREKVVLILLIFLLNATVVFYIIAFGRLLCPNFDKVWNADEVLTHQGGTDFWVSIHGRVYDISTFWTQQHSDTSTPTTEANMLQFAGQDLDEYFVPPLTVGCQFLVTDTFPQLIANTTVAFSPAVHISGPRWQTDTQSALHSIDWYKTRFMPKIAHYYKGDVAWDQGNITAQYINGGRQWFILHGRVYDLTDYLNTVSLEGTLPMYNFFPTNVLDVMKSNMGQDLSSEWKNDGGNFTNSLSCLDQVFYKGITDFRNTPRCQVNNYILLGFTVVLCAVILIKFLAALQFGSRRRPPAQDKFVICQVPAYTEGEDQLRKGLDSLTALQYDNKRKLLCVMCDGMIVGGGNDRPTPKIVLDILGVDPKVDPPALPFKSVGQGSEQLNYGKVYSGLYEFEGNVVPYVVVVKVGKESEQSKAKPGNRGKRDSQIILLSFLNRVHHRSPMSPLELEMFHQINNIIGVDPELYEYLFMVDADTSVREDSLNRLVASCAHDSKIAGICGETSLQNEERSWWTMIQVYEYFISHHLAKAFESLFGSVTCLPGCFCMYRLRTADKGKPLIIADQVIEDYSDCNVDTLHKKNLLALGEDRYLTTLMMRHFPSMSYKFIPDAFAATAAPETWSVLLSQRRRWINSTIHNLAELVFLKDLCGFCCFSMRFVIFIDLFGTIILPATCAYLGYLIYRVATHSGQFPLISIIMLAAVYGLQALVFILKRQWQHVGWMIIYILAFPVYSFILPIYSFWKQDDFSWGNTRIVIGERGTKQVVSMEDDGFNPRSIPLQRWDDYAAANGLPGRRGDDAGMEKSYHDVCTDNAIEMDEMRSLYSSPRPASTILTGFPTKSPAYMLPLRSPTTPSNMHRQSTASGILYADQPQYQPTRTQSRMSTMEPYRDNVSNYRKSTTMLSTYEDANPQTSMTSLPLMANQYRGDSQMTLPLASSQENLLGLHSPPLPQSRSPINGSRPASAMELRIDRNGPDEHSITGAIRSCLMDVDLDTITKKQVRALVEQHLQTEVTGELRSFLDHQIDTELSNM